MLAIQVFAAEGILLPVTPCPLQILPLCFFHPAHLADGGLNSDLVALDGKAVNLLCHLAPVPQAVPKFHETVTIRTRINPKLVAAINIANEPDSAFAKTTRAFDLGPKRATGFLSCAMMAPFIQINKQRAPNIADEK